ncbi:MAG: efflux RND transporter periplasmic adaptor subunit [Magnetococcales bacterium]|nr:efflux RND transporter periplasmic adaptor subunit [Magnetococcales bacterium]
MGGEQTEQAEQAEAVRQMTDKILPAEANPPPGKPWGRRIGLLLLLALIGIIWQQWPQIAPYLPGQAGKGGEGGKGGKGDWRGKGGPVPVVTAQVTTGPIRLQLESLGTVLPAQWVVVRSRVDGPLLRVFFQEGETVTAGQLLAEIDPKPFEIQLDQARGQLTKDQALLENAQRDANRYRTLLKEDSVSRQQADTQLALVRQYQGSVQVDQALVESAALQLSYTRITAPIKGVTGLRQVDPGNMIRQSDGNGLVTIAQIRPIQVLFTLAEDQLPRLLQYWRPGATLPVTLYDRERKNRLAEGKMVTLDNQIDSSTGTVKLKAEFANEDGKLFPHQFVNVSLTLAEYPQALLIPSPAVQHSRKGLYVYRVKEDQTVSQQMVKTGAVQGEVTAIEEGLQAGDNIVVEGVDKLREGSRIQEPRADAEHKEGQPAEKKGSEERQKGRPTGEGGADKRGRPAGEP